jgi:hypothetical protein
VALRSAARTLVSSNPVSGPRPLATNFLERWLLVSNANLNSSTAVAWRATGVASE